MSVVLEPPGTYILPAYGQGGRRRELHPQRTVDTSDFTEVLEHL